jgi:hypothetical protein
MEEKFHSESDNAVPMQAKMSKKDVFQKRVVDRIDEDFEQSRSKLGRMVKIEGRLKEALLTELKSGGDDPSTEKVESYSDDLSLSPEELDSILEMSHIRGLLYKAGLTKSSFTSIYLFRSYSEQKGIQALKKGERLVNGQIVANVGEGVEIKREESISNLEAMVSLLSGDERFAGKVAPGSIRATGRNVLAFSVRGESGLQEYVMIQQSFYKVLEHPDEKGVKEFGVLVAGLEQKKEEYSQYRADTLMHAKEKRPVWAGKLKAEISQLESQAAELIGGALGMLVEDVENGERFRQYHDPWRDQFVSEKLGDEGEVSIRWSSAIKDGVLKTEKRLSPGKWDIKEKGSSGEFLSHEVRDDKEGRSLYYREDNSLLGERDGRIETEFVEDGKPVWRLYKSKKTGDVLRAFVYDSKGEPISVLPEEQEFDDDMTEDKYIDHLAKSLGTPEKLGVFMQFYMNYTADHNSNSEISIWYKLKRSLGKELSEEYWQKGEQTVRRVEGNKMLGDCDDYAFLAKRILERQAEMKGIDRAVQVLAIPGHAICVWTEKRPDGKYDFFSVDTMGLDVNGQKMQRNRDFQTSEGFDSMEDGLKALYQRFENMGWDGQTEHATEVDVLEIPEEGGREYVKAPVEVLKGKEYYLAWKQLKPYLENEDYAGFGKAVEALSPKPDYYLWASRWVEKHPYKVAGLSSMYMEMYQRLNSKSG